MATPPRLLVVDDDERILEILTVALQEQGYRVESTTEGERALEMVRASPPDALLLDVMMPGADGFELCREIRKFSNLPIIMVTAKTDTVDVVVGLESGADDYITKPFEVREVHARLRALLRRARARDGAEDEILRAGPLEIRPAEGIVRKHGEPVPLTSTEFRLLCMLASKPGRVYTRENLLSEVWGYDYFGDARLVDVHIRRLRAKVEDDASAPTIVQTVRGMGYRVAEGD